MNLIELHILQSVPVTCLNRDDVGAPKSAIFGGVTRARVSSQCWKRASRERARQYAPEIFAGERTKYIVAELKKLFLNKDITEELSAKLALITADAIGKLDVKKDKDIEKVKTLLFFTPQELENVVNAVLQGVSGKDDEINNTYNALITGKTEKGKKLFEVDKNVIKRLGTKTKDMADIALFGRMVADDATLTMEGAALFSHAISTHAVASEIDFFSAVDDARKGADDAGAGHIGTIEFNSACYYRYVGINLDLLKSNMGDAANDEEIMEILKSFIKAVILAVPNARKNSMFGWTPPSYVLGLRREGQPISLANAFEKPIRSKDGIVDDSKKALDTEWEKMKSVFGEKASVEECLPNKSLDELIKALLGE